MKILLIEDDLEITHSLSLALKNSNFIIDSAPDGEKGLFLALANDYDLIILDYNLPKLDGRQVLEEIKRKKPSLPVIILTVRSEIEDKVKLLNSGADDYLTKPFALSELLARIKVVSRRPGQISGDILRIGDLELDPTALIFKVKDRIIDLTPREFSLLQHLMENKNRVVSRQEIIEQVWDDNVDPFSNTIEVHVMRLRRKINNQKRKLILTCSNRGYRMADKK